MAAVHEFAFFDVFQVVPVTAEPANTIGFLLNQRGPYRETCPLLSAEVNYDTHRIVVYAVIDKMDPFGQDSLLDVTLGDEEWARIEEQLGPYERHREYVLNQHRTLAVAPALNRNGRLELGLTRKIFNFLGGKRSVKGRKARKTKKTQKRKN